MYLLTYVGTIYKSCWQILFLYFHFFALVSRLSAAFSSATQHAMPPEFGRKWETECLNTRFSLPTMLCVGYSMIKKRCVLVVTFPIFSITNTLEQGSNLQPSRLQSLCATITPYRKKYLI